MKRGYAYILILILGLLVWRCDNNLISESGGSDNPDDTAANDKWLIPREKVYDGGPGKDGIPSIDEPEFLPVDQVDYLNENDLVLGLKQGDKTKAYPHRILDWHEIVNDKAGNRNVAVTYCPLTGTGIAWNREINNKTTTFGVSGLLYKNNLIPYDRATDSYWSQMLNQSIHGEHIKTKAETFQLIETTWSTWKSMYPGSRVLSTQTGYDRNYRVYPYGDYKETAELIFPVDPLDERLFLKKRVLGLTGGDQTKAYQFKDFSDSVHIVGDTLNDEHYIIISSQKSNFLVAYKNQLQEGNKGNFQLEPLQDQLPLVMKDQQGNRWNIFGEAVAGPEKGEKLQRANAFIGYWFAWSSFYPDIKIYNEP